jgi:predicted exporter
MLLVLPPLIVLSEQLLRGRSIPRPPSTLGLGRLAATVQNYPVLTLTVGLIVTAYLGFFAQRIGFEDDVGKMRKPSPAYEDLIRRTSNRFELPSNQVIAIVSAPTMQEALEVNDRLYRRLEEARRQFPLLGFDSLRTVLPSVATQRRAHAKLHVILNIDKLEDQLRLLAKREDMVSTVAVAMLERLRTWKAAATDANLVRFGEPEGPAYEELVGRVVRRPDDCRIATHIYPRQGVWEETVPENFVRYLRKAVGALEITGLTFVAEALKRNLIHGMVRAVLLVVLAIFLLLVIHFRSVRRAFVATIPVLCSVIWTLGTLQLLGIQLNFLNVIVIPLIVGLGIDDGVHILQRFYEGGRRDLESAVEQSGRAVVVTSLTTMIAFGTLSFTTFQGVREIGLVVIMGVGFALVASVFLVPALLRLVGGRLRLVDLLGGGEDDRTP